MIQCIEDYGTCSSEENSILNCIEDMYIVKIAFDIRGRQSEMPGGTGTCSEVSPELLSCPPSANELSAFHLVFVSATVKLQLHTCNDEQSYKLEFHSKKNLHKIVSTACNNVRCRYFFSPRHLKFDQSLENPIWSLIRVLNSLENPRAQIGRAHV